MLNTLYFLRFQVRECVRVMEEEFSDSQDEFELGEYRRKTIRDLKILYNNLQLMKDVMKEWDKCQTDYNVISIWPLGDNAFEEQHMTDIRHCKFTCLRCADYIDDFRMAFVHEKLQRPYWKNLNRDYVEKITDEAWPQLLTRFTACQALTLPVDSYANLLEYLEEILGYIIAHNDNRVSIVGEYPAFLRSLVEEPPTHLDLYVEAPSIYLNTEDDPDPHLESSRIYSSNIRDSYDRYVWLLILVLDSLGMGIFFRKTSFGIDKNPVLMTEVGKVRYIFFCRHHSKFLFYKVLWFTSRFPSDLKWEIRKGKFGGSYLRFTGESKAFPELETELTCPLTVVENTQEYVKARNVPALLSVFALKALEQRNKGQPVDFFYECSLRKLQHHATAENRKFMEEENEKCRTGQI